MPRWSPPVELSKHEERWSPAGPGTQAARLSATSAHDFSTRDPAELESMYRGDRRWEGAGSAPCMAIGMPGAGLPGVSGR